MRIGFRRVFFSLLRNRFLVQILQGICLLERRRRRVEAFSYLTDISLPISCLFPTEGDVCVFELIPNCSPYKSVLPPLSSLAPRTETKRDRRRKPKICLPPTYISTPSCITITFGLCNLNNAAGIFICSACSPIAGT